MKILGTILIFIFMMGIMNISNAQTTENKKLTKEEVLEVMQKFQDGYIKRDTAVIDDFLELFTKDIVCIGVASHEFIFGIEGVREITLWDWKKWFDLRIPLDKIDIQIVENVAWFGVKGSSGPWRDNKTYEIRIVGSLIKVEGKLQFKQICYSYPAPLKVIE